MSAVNYKKFWPSGDNYIQSNVNDNNGTAAFIQVGETGTDYRGLIKFDLTAIPANATVTEAILYMASASSASGQAHTFHRLVREWGETTSTWSLADTGISWGTAGCANTTTDYNSTSLGAMTHPASGVFDSLDITATVQNWIDGTNPNYGLRISSALATTDRWHSRQGATIALWPYIETLYTIPQIGYAVNGTTVSAGVRAEWLPLEVGANANGAPRYAAKWYTHRWHIAEMGMSDWLTMHNLRGTALTGLTTTNYDTPNVAATYATANLQSVTGRQQGRQMINVMVEFLVDETS